MARFTVVQDTDGTYEDAVRSLWQRYLPGTPGARYPWMAAGNPAGRSDWLVALAEESGEVAGVLSIMPRFFWGGGKRLRAGILGDFMVEKKYRLYGPTLLLPGKAGEWQAALGYDVLYTVPNREAVRVIVRAGLRDTIRVRHYARPLSSRYYVEKRLGGIWAAPAAAVLDLGLHLLSRDNLAPPQGVVRRETRVDASFDDFWAAVRDAHPGTIGDHGSAYLSWRFLRHPERTFEFLTCRDRGGALQGYAVFTADASSLSIHTMLARRPRVLFRLVRALRRAGRAQGKRVLYLAVNEGSPLVPRLKGCRFVDAQDDIAVHFRAAEGAGFSGAQLFSGDRNL